MFQSARGTHHIKYQETSSSGKRNHGIVVLVCTIRYKNNQKDQYKSSGDETGRRCSLLLLTLGFLLAPVEGLHDAIGSVIVPQARHAEVPVGALLRRQAVEVAGAGDVDAGGRRAILIRLRVLLAREREAEPVVGGSHLRRAVEQ